MLYDDLRTNMRLVCTSTGPWTCLEAGKIYTVHKSLSGGHCIPCSIGVHQLLHHVSNAGYLTNFDKAAP